MAITAKKLEDVRATVPEVSGELVRVNLLTDKATRRHWAQEAFNRDISLSDLIRLSVTKYLQESNGS